MKTVFSLDGFFSMKRLTYVLLFSAAALITSCGRLMEEHSTSTPVAMTSTAAIVTESPTLTSTLTATPSSTSTLTNTPSPTPTITPTPTPTSTPTLQPISLSNIHHLKEVFRIGKGTINGLAWWPDDQTLAVTTYAGIFLYDGDTFEQIEYIEPPENLTSFYIALSPDGRTVASAEQSDNFIHLWDATTGQVIQVLDGHPNDVIALAFSPDNAYLASGGYQRPVQLWDVNTGEVIQTFQGRTEYLDFSPDGEYLVSAGAGNPYKDPGRVWEVSSGKLISSFPNLYNPYNPRFLISTDGKLIYSEWDQGWGIHVRDMQTGKLINSLADCCWGSINFSSDGKRIIIGGDPVKIWDIETDNLTTLKEGVRVSGYLLLSPDGSKLVSGAGTLFVWDLETGQIQTTIGGFSESTDAVFSPDSKRLTVSGSSRIWDRDSGMLNVYKFCGYVLGFSPDGRLISSTCSEQGEDGAYHTYACLFDTTTCEEVLRFEGELEQWTSSPTFSSDGNLFALAHGADWRGEGKWNIWVWDTIDGKIKFSLTHPRFYSLAFSPDDSYLAVGGSKTLRFIDPQSGEVQFEDFQTSPIRELLFSPDGNLLISAGYSNIQAWNTNTFEKSFSFPFGIQNLNGIDISPDGTMLASIHTPYEVRILRLWNLITGESVYTLEGDHLNFGKVRFNRDGSLLATTGLSTKGMQIWDANSGDLLWTYERTPTYNAEDIINFSPDGQLLTFVGRDGAVRVFAACDKECPHQEFGEQAENR